MSRPRLAPDVRRPSADVLIGGSPTRLVRLAPKGVEALDALLTGAPHAGAAALQRRLGEAGILLPPPGPPRTREVTVVVPALATADEVEVTLASVPDGVPIIVVDDGCDPPLVDALPRRAGLRVLRTTGKVGAAAARNLGASAVTTRLIAFVDTDVVVPSRGLDRLTGHLRDGVIAVAPRIVSRAGSGWADVLERDLCALDLGPDTALVHPGTRVPYVPSTVLLVERSAFDAVGGFDPALHIAEDVDLVWRLAARGRVRYEPDVVAAHGPRTEVRAALARRRVYGGSAGPLDRRHPGLMHHGVLSRWSLPFLAALLHPALGAVTAAGLLARAGRDTAPVPRQEARRMTAHAVWDGTASLGRYAIRPMWPVTLLAAVASRRARGRLRIVAAAYAAATLPDLLGAPQRRVPARAVLRVADDIAYGVGVWDSCMRERRISPLLPRIARRDGRMRLRHRLP